MAIEYEQKAHDVYVDAVAVAKTEPARRFFSLMAAEEASHVEYLKRKLHAWSQNGRIDVDELHSAVPSSDMIAKGMADLEQGFSGTDRQALYGPELEALKRALEAETRTSEFYRSMVEELSGEHGKLFARFLDIEEGHKAAVLAEIEAIENSGFCCDMQEFDQELGV